jgi:DNA-binding response OmpR family regulator
LAVAIGERCAVDATLTVKESGDPRAIMDAMPHRILVVEDEPHIAELIALHLEDLGCEVAQGATVAAAERRLGAQAGGFDLVVLDLMLPDGDGLDLCRAMRQRQDFTPILILTARSSETDRVVGLELGADDYLIKPFSVRELVARVKAILRRVELSGAAAMGAAERIAVDDLLIDRARRQVTVGGQPVQLTAREFDLLAHFASRPGRVFTRAQLLDLVWGSECASYEHTVSSHINRLRAKIEADPARPRYLQTVWGVGYRFREPGEPSRDA